MQGDDGRWTRSKPPSAADPVMRALEAGAGSNALDWDPRPHERELVRHQTRGDLGWIVRRGGRKMVRLDRPNQDIVQKYIADDWAPEETARPITRMHLAHVAFEADRALCRALGLLDHARREWTSLTDAERHGWMRGGPRSPAPRSTLYGSIMGAMKELVRGGD